MEDKRKGFFSGFISGLLAGILILAVICGGKYVLDRMNGDYTGGLVSEKDVTDKLDRINELIGGMYLYEEDIDREALIDGIYSGYTAALGDPYTTYFDKE